MCRCESLSGTIAITDRTATSGIHAAYQLQLALNLFALQEAMDRLRHDQLTREEQRAVERKAREDQRDCERNGFEMERESGWR